MKLLTIVLLCTILTVCHGYRILGVFPFNGKSHFMMFEQLMKALARKGHQVDVISTFPLKKPYPNYNDMIVLKAPRDFMNNMTYDDVSLIMRDVPSYVIATLAGNDVCHHLNDPQFQELIRNPPKNPPYDVVIMEVFGAHCFAILGDILKVPVIGASSSVLYPWAYDFIGYPDNFAFAPSILLPYSQHMNFWQRMYNFMHTLQSKWQFTSASSEQTELLRKYVSPDSPTIRELERKMAMILVNSHISINGIKDSTPALVEVGGLHIQEDDMTISPSLEKWMNESTKGFIYFSFGSMVKIESFPSRYLDIFYNSMAKIAPVRVLMKIAKPDELQPGLPKNVHVLPWIPQVKVFKHRNLKAFITHGGLMGTQEAIHYGIPLIGIPLFADQFINIDTYVRKNIAIGLDIDTLTEEKLDKALNDILNDSKYRDTVRKVSERFLDRPLTAADTAVYWVEYIIRHGANALRSPAMDLTWWQVELLDVGAFLLIVALGVLYILATVVQFMFYLTNSSQGVSRKKKVA